MRRVADGLAKYPTWSESWALYSAACDGVGLVLDVVEEPTLARMWDMSEAGASGRFWRRVI